MHRAMITRTDFTTLIAILRAFIAGERPVDLLARATVLLATLTSQRLP
jgi:hypothetical protein